MRKDAERNRDKLIEAASRIMREGDGDVAMEAFAEEAQVARATLYRNFPHRQSIYEAVLERDLELLAARIAGAGADDPLAFLRFTAELMTVYDRFLARLVDMPDYDADKNQARMRVVLAAPLAAAQRDGHLRADLTPENVLMAARMLASLWKLDGTTNFTDSFERRLSLLMRGLASPVGGDRSKVAPAR